MKNEVIKVESMSCMHCVNAIKKAVGGLKGVETVEVDLNGKTVAVSYDEEKVTLSDIKNAIEDQGYDVT